MKSRTAGHSRTATSAAVVEIKPSETTGRRSAARAEIQPCKRGDVKSADLCHDIDGIGGIRFVLRKTACDDAYLAMVGLVREACAAPCHFGGRAPRQGSNDGGGRSLYCRSPFPQRQ